MSAEAPEFDLFAPFADPITLSMECLDCATSTELVAPDADLPAMVPYCRAVEYELDGQEKLDILETPLRWTDSEPVTSLTTTADPPETMTLLWPCCPACGSIDFYRMHGGGLMDETVLHIRGLAPEYQGKELCP